MTTIPGGARIGRLSATLAAVVISTFTAAGPASAAPSSHVEEHYVSVTGVPIVAPGAMAYLQSFHSSLLGSDAGFQLWIEPDVPWLDPPTYTSGPAQLTVGAGDSSLTGTFDLLDRQGSVAGTGVLEALLEPIGELQEVTWPKSGGNDKHRESQVYQDMAVTGSVVARIGATEYVLPLEGASGFAADFTAFDNAPAASVEWQTFTQLGLLAEGDLTVQLLMREEGGAAITEVVVQHADQIFTTLDDGSGTTFEGGRYAVELELLPGGGSGIAATGGTISVSASVQPAERFAWTDTVDGATVRFVIQTYTIDGTATVTLDDGTSRTFAVDDAIAHAEQVSFRSFLPAE